jgi:hypothetical protein
MATKLEDYQALRANVAARLALRPGDPGAASSELSSLMTALLHVTDAQAGLPALDEATRTSDAAFVGSVGGFENLVQRACVLSQAEWQSIIIPRRLYELATLASA